HAAKDGALAIVAVAVDEKVDDRVVIGHGGEVRKREQRLDLGREQEVARRRGVVERLDSEPVARAEQAAQPAIPDGEREHALNAFETALAPPSVRLEQHLGIGARAEPAARPLQLAPQLAMVVDLAIEND